MYILGPGLYFKDNRTSLDSVMSISTAMTRVIKIDPIPFTFLEKERNSMSVYLVYVNGVAFAVKFLTIPFLLLDMGLHMY